MTSSEDVPRGWVVPSDGADPVELPAYLVGPDPIFWPEGSTQDPGPGRPIRSHSAKNTYKRHVLKPENIYVYVVENRDPNGLSEEINQEIRRQAKSGN